MKPNKYVAIDPGDTSGWATFDEDGEITGWGQFAKKDITAELSRLITSNIVAVICEDYRNYAWKKQRNWSRNDTSKLIGKIELLCDLKSVKCVLQAASVKPVGYKWAGLGEAPSNHGISHQYDAIAHGVYYLQNNGVRPVGKALMENEK